ncbi:hypothetical protein GCM10010402_65790 [Actinomadura luteofluorescens]|uniref:hypothetical protein n=1 Tax=Actinomadura luteofluorescens TaxID=46163 RepID=UPI0021646F1C|nr:hypothetical protein [Actinomadura glauciflava]MCR3737507.1 hypothetical protein [Actinomadura glauciflava]
MRRISAHLTRSKARAGWTLTALCLLGYFAVGGNEPLKQFFLVVIGVTAGAVFLPELGDDLWKLNGDQVRRTVPDHRVTRLQQSLIQARCDSPEWADIVWHEGLAPLLEAGSRAQQIVWDAKYDVVLRLDAQRINGRVYHRVETLSRARRVLPPVRPRRYWISAARTEDALATEFGVPNCLVREIISIPSVEPADWRDLVIGACRVQMTVNGTQLQVQTDISESLLDVVRWYIDVPTEEWVDTAVPYTLQFDFPIPQEEHTFPVILNGYYSAGATEISLRLNDASGVHRLDCSSFVAHGLGRHAGDLIRHDAPDQTFVMFSTPSSSLLWPGSGVLFHW